LGSGKKATKGNVEFYCPICNHKNPKLIVNVSSGMYNCFTCHPATKGKTPVSLLRKIGAPAEAISEMKGYFPGDNSKVEAEAEIKLVQLPKELRSLTDPADQSLEKRRAMAYLKTRGIQQSDVKKYNIGYCAAGRYRNKVVIPSYDSNGRVNYFVARSFEKDPKIKIDSPDCKKSELVGFESNINWTVPVILCEGVFDAMAIKRNAIPLFGSTIPKAVMIKLLQPEVKTIYLALDEDALKKSIEHAQKLLDFGKEVYLIQLKGKDPSEIGFEGMIQYLHRAQPLTPADLMTLKIETALC
jgi:DNA primase